MEFTSTKYAVRLAEHAVVNRPPLRQKDDALRALTEDALIGPWLVMAGFATIWKRTAWGFFLAMIFLTVVWLVDASPSGSAWFAAMTLGLGCVYFGLPTRTVLTGVSENAIQIVCDGIHKKYNDLNGLDRLCSGVNIVKVQAKERLGRLSVLLGAVWAALFWFIGSRVLSPGVSPEVLGKSVPLALTLGMFFVILLVVVASYATAIRVVFQTLDFALRML